MTMNNLEAAFNTLERHREARAWDAKIVAADLLNQLGLEPSAEATNATVHVEPVDVPTAQEVADAEASAQHAMDKWTTLRQRRLAYEAEAHATAQKGTDDSGLLAGGTGGDAERQRSEPNTGTSQDGIVANEAQQTGADQGAGSEQGQ
jgi:hypothetical protein